MRVVLDSNVLFSALISPYSPPHKIFLAWQNGRFELITCREQIEEIRRASRYPKLQRILQGHRVGTLINRLYLGNLVDKLPQDMQTHDPEDAFLLALSQAGKADILVTGDKRSGLLRMGSHRQARIVTPTIFCREILRTSD
ncbi:putative toxin-antitoxin system toxin component, PIN family [Desulfonatronospira sp.]|uniref:putative toxin-antitoxin system toxin component, PIN family n=1 Tax=Desulfonatronospira sp. TaxID=1962951 RepID=UPI0025BA64B6|nr:putative toxin-antitoxin system toxin component, PIN family [Desulfonatronospira sp.]